MSITARIKKSQNTTYDLGHCINNHSVGNIISNKGHLWVQMALSVNKCSPLEYVGFNQQWLMI